MIHEYDKNTIYKVFSEIALDIEGSNLENTGWMPSKEDVRYMGEESYKLAVEKCNLKNEKVIFKNVKLNWDSCDCGDGYGCSHGSYVYEINIVNKDKTHTVEYTDGDSLEFINNTIYCRIPSVGVTIHDFIRMCELCEIELEFSDYAIKLINP